MVGKARSPGSKPQACSTQHHHQASWEVVKIDGATIEHIPFVLEVKNERSSQLAIAGGNLLHEDESNLQNIINSYIYCI